MLLQLMFYSKYIQYIIVFNAFSWAAQMMMMTTKAALLQY